MQTVTQSFRLLWSALFLEEAAYATMSKIEGPVKKGLVILIILGLALGVAGFISASLEWASSPSLNAIKETVEEINQQSPWWQFMEQDPEALAMFEQIWDQVWQIVGFMVPSPASSLSGLIARPLGLIISWLIFGLVLHLFARWLGGTAALGQTLGATSLAAAPQLLGLVAALPFVVVAGIGVWTLLCRYMAVRVTHELSWARAVWAVLLAFLLLIFLGFILAFGLGILFGYGLAATFGGGL
ncbi:MAG: Yip1 family protein [Candidatus Promineifilaceae bacterium]|nr:Yip1 family protein [Candidatus Promineifilaceae bacterium]